MITSPYGDSIFWEVDLHGYAKKLDTQLADQKEPNAPHGYVCTGLAKVTPIRRKGTLGIMNENTILQARANPNEGKTLAQEPKQVNLGLPIHGTPNQHNRGIRDATASILLQRRIMRTRNCNITATGSRKYSTIRKSSGKGGILESKLYKVVLSQLDEYKQKDGRYNGISRIISPSMLKSCYSLIKSNPGNMTRGATTETLDKINNE